MWPSSPKFEGHAELVDEIGSLQRLVNQLLDVARLDVLQLGADNVADLTSVATEVASHLGPTAIDNGRSIEVVAPDEPVRIRGASDYLFRALRNIVENALRYTPEGTTVSIVVANPPAISVIDRGPGVPPDQRTRHLSPLLAGRSRANKGGAGLGMDIAARTVVAHGGVMSVEDAPEGGAVFTMQFESLPVPETRSPARATAV